ncbi:MAG: hypothetical protein P8Y07_13405, partial [Gemmatimonadales bacterium]
MPVPTEPQRARDHMITRFKVCCIGGREEASLAIAYGASAIGLVSEMPSGPGVIPEPLIREIAAAVSPSVSTFLLTSRTEASEIADQLGLPVVLKIPDGSFSRGVKKAATLQDLAALKTEFLADSDLALAQRFM